MHGHRLKCSWVVAAFLAGSTLFPSVAGAFAVPAPGDPLIVSVSPIQAQEGQQVVLFGLNFGNSPEVRLGGVLTTVVSNRPPRGDLIVTIPAGVSSGPLTVTALTVTNAISGLVSDPVDFYVESGIYTTDCTISGTITASGMLLQPGALVTAGVPVTEQFTAAAVTDLAGGYSLALPASPGGYLIYVDPPEGDRSLEHVALASCPDTMDHEFATGFALSGTVRSVVSPFDPIRNALVLVEGPGISGTERFTPADGTFTVHVPSGTYDIFVDGPIGQPFLSNSTSAEVVLSDISVGDIPLGTGLLLSGVLRSQDGPTVRALMGADLELFDILGSSVATGISIADGRFFVPAPTGLTGDNLLRVNGGAALVPLEVRSIVLSSDFQFPEPIFVYSSDPQAPATPNITESEFSFGSIVAQTGERLDFSAFFARGSSVEVRFSDNAGGFVIGTDTHADSQRRLIVTKVPLGAVSGTVTLVADGVEGSGFPATILPGEFMPGPDTLSGTVTDGVGQLQSGVLIVLVTLSCNESIVDYMVTGVDGAYSLNHPSGDFALFILPPVGSGLALEEQLVSLSGSELLNVILSPTSTVTALLSDSGVGLVGNAGAPIENGFFDGENLDLGTEDGGTTNSLGQATITISNGFYEFFFGGPFQSRYLEGGAPQQIDADFDFGGIPIDSGYFIEGYVVDDLGNGLPGTNVTVFEAATSEWFGETYSVDASGRFRVPVASAGCPPGGCSYHLSFDPPSGADLVIPEIFNLQVPTDTLLFPPVQAISAGRIRGTVFQADGVTPVPEVLVLLFDSNQSIFIDATDTCGDGAYSFVQNGGGYTVQALPSHNDPCLADEFYNGAQFFCPADIVSVTDGVTTGGIDFTLDQVGGISGSVVDDLGLAVPGATVCVDNGPASPACARACTAPVGGSYSFTNLPVRGDYRVGVSSGTFTDECWNDHLLCTEHDPIVVADCADTSGINFTLSNAAGSVPGSVALPGAPMTVEHDRNTGELTVRWQPACSSSDHALYFGALGSPGAYSHALCSIGVSGEVTFIPPPGGALFWVIAGTNSGTEGSYGLQSSGVERPDDLILCGLAQDLSATCAVP